MPLPIPSLALLIGSPPAQIATYLIAAPARRDDLKKQSYARIAAQRSAERAAQREREAALAAEWPHGLPVSGPAGAGAWTPALLVWGACACLYS